MLQCCFLLIILKKEQHPCLHILFYAGHTSCSYSAACGGTGIPWNIFGSYRKVGMFGAAVISGLIFGCFHLNINQGLYAFAIGFVFAYMVEATGSLWPSVIAHFAINTYSIGVVQLLKMAGMYTADGQAAEVLEGEGEFAASAGTMATVIQLVIFAAIAAAFMMLTVLCIKTMANVMEDWKCKGTDRRNKRRKEILICTGCIRTGSMYMLYDNDRICV